MRIESLELEQFRNYRLQTVDFDPRCNVIFGANAQGKTNLLEAIVYLSCGRSPRARSDREMIGFDAVAARLTATVLAREREFRVQAELFRDRRRKLSVNKVPAKNSAALSEVYHTVPRTSSSSGKGPPPDGSSWILRYVNFAPGMPRRSRSTTGSTSTRPASSGTARSGRTCWPPCRTSTSRWCASAPF